jgi:hypothetical protein
MQAQVLESVGGLLAAFALVSVVASAAVELVSTLFQKRSKDLRIAIDRMTDPKADGSIDIKESATWATLSAASRRKRGVGMGYDDRTPSYISARAFRDAVIEQLRRRRKDGESLHQVATRLPESHLKHKLVDLFEDAGEDLAVVRSGLEHWFDDAMDRLQGSYKRWTQWFLLLFGLAFAAALNVSTVRIVDSLWNDPTLRAAYTASIDRVASQCPNDQSTCSAAQMIEGAIRDARDLSLPVGWGRGWHEESGKGWTILGILPTGLAAVMGAPFWFDLLRRVVGGNGGRGVPPRADDDTGSATTAMTRPSTMVATVPVAAPAVPAASPQAGPVVSTTFGVRDVLRWGRSLLGRARKADASD